MWLASCTLLLYVVIFALADEKIISQSPEVKASNFEDGQVTRDDDSKSTVRSIISNLEKGKKMVTLASDRKIILVLGNTGAGKSTLVQLITGNNSNLISKSTSVNPNLPTDEFTIVDTENKIGNSAIFSHTEFPELVLDSETNTAMYDCPGFSDTRNPEYDISGSFYIKYILDYAEAVKFVFVINYNSVKVNNEKSDFMLLATHATNMIKNITQFKDGIAIVATKVNGNTKNNFIINNIVNFLETVKSELSKKDNKNFDVSQKENIAQFIDALLTNDTNGTRYPRIGFFRSPEEEGPLINITKMQDNKKLLKLLLRENIKYIKSHKEDFGYTISEKSQNYINELVNEINNNALSSVKNVATRVQEYYDDLVQNMLKKILSFVDSAIHVDCDLSEAQSFLTKLNTGHDVISILTKEIDDIKSLEELSKKINRLLTILNINISQDIISNILTQVEYLEFLHTVGKKKTNSLVSKAWVSEWQNCSSHVMKLKEFIQENVNTVLQQTTNKIEQNIADSGQEIITFFSKEENNNDLQNIYNEIYIGHYNLSKTPFFANRLNSTYTCVNKIKDDISNLNITNASISLDNVLLSTMKYATYVDFLKILQPVIDQKPFECAKKLNSAIEYLKSSQQWYDFLIRLYEHLSEYKIQNNPTECITLSNNAIQGGKNLTTFLNKCYPEFHVSDIENVSQNELKLHALKNVFNTTLKSEITSTCETESFDNYSYEKLVIKGQYVKLKDIDKSNCTNAKIIVIFALKKVFIDVDLDKTGEEIQLFIIAPIWDIQGNRKIVLRGKSPNPYLVSAKDGQDTIRNGEDGEPGEPGGPGGYFTGIGVEFINYMSLTIDTSGGNGSGGQNGGIGVNGIDAPDIQLSDIGTYDDFKTNVRETYYNEVNEIKCNHFHKNFEESYDCSRNQYHFNGFSYRLGIHTVHGLFGKKSFKVTFFSPDSNNITINDKCVGGTGGRGGKGGGAGYPGNATIIPLREKIQIKVLNNEGVRGSDGEHGKNGVGGKCSRELIVYFENRDPTNWSEDKSMYYGKRMCTCKNNHTHSDYKTKKKESKERGPKLLQVSFTINDYKTYLRENLISDVQKSNLETFLKLIENSNDDRF